MTFGQVREHSQALTSSLASCLSTDGDRVLCDRPRPLRHAGVRSNGPRCRLPGRLGRSRRTGLPAASSPSRLPILAATPPDKRAVTGSGRSARRVRWSRAVAESARPAARCAPVLAGEPWSVPQRSAVSDWSGSARSPLCTYASGVRSPVGWLGRQAGSPRSTAVDARWICDCPRRPRRRRSGRPVHFQAPCAAECDVATDAGNLHAPGPRWIP